MALQKKRITDYPETTEFTGNDYLMMEQYDSTEQEYDTKKIKAINLSGSGLVDYSTDEQNTGLKWINGKPLYQKTIIVDSFSSSSGGKMFDVNVPNLENGQILSGYWNIGTTNLSLNEWIANNNVCYVHIDTNTYNIHGFIIGFTPVEAVVTIQYTKTTD